VRGYSLAVVAGPDNGQRWVSTGERSFVGTHPSCEVVLTDATVSRFQVELGVAGKVVTMRDLGSANGTLVDGVAVQIGTLKTGALVTLGRTQLRFEVVPEPVRVPLSTRTGFGRLRGLGAAMRRVFAQLERAAADDAPLLLEGEAGTGKAEAAAAVHAEGPRQGRPFVALDCAGVGPDGFAAALAEALAAARGGTLYLREVGEVPLGEQLGLAALVESGRLDGEPLDTRIIASARLGLRLDVNARRVRSELYRRLAASICRLPPLRERTEDLPALIEEALTRLGAAASPAGQALLASDTVAELARRGWPGNVRQLFDFVARAVGAAGADTGRESVGAFAAARAEWEQRFEHDYLEGLLAAHGGNLGQVACAAGVDRAALVGMLERHGLG
jgi:DNA-binding NtrC family response regulator